MDKKNKTYQFAAYKKFTSFKDTHHFQVKRWKNIFHASENQKTALVAMLIPDKTDFMLKKKRQGKLLYNDKGVNSSRRYNRTLLVVQWIRPRLPIQRT